MTASATRQRPHKEPVVNVALNGGRVTAGFRAELFAAANRNGISVNEYVLHAAGEKLRASGRKFAGVFMPGDLNDFNGGMGR